YIASDPGHYIELAVAKAGDLAALAELRRTLRERIAGTAFGDPVRYARAVEGQYRSMWRRWGAQQRRGARPPRRGAPPRPPEGVGERLGLQVRERMVTVTAGRGDIRLPLLHRPRSRTNR